MAVVASLIGNLSHPAVPRMTSLVIVDVSVGMDESHSTFSTTQVACCSQQMLPVYGPPRPPGRVVIAAESIFVTNISGGATNPPCFSSF